MNGIKYCITHTEGTDVWKLMEWAPTQGWFWNRGVWRHIDTCGTEAGAVMRMNQLATAVTSRKYYDEYGGEHVNGW